MIEGNSQVLHSKVKQAFATFGNLWPMSIDRDEGFNLLHLPWRRFPESLEPFHWELTDILQNCQQKLHSTSPSLPTPTPLVSIPPTPLATVSGTHTGLQPACNPENRCKNSSPATLRCCLRILVTNYKGEHRVK